jgi:hypothetical protein
VIAERLQQVAFDPVESPDLVKAKEAAEFATLVVKRLRTILPRLQECHQRATATERATRWRRTADAVEVKRNAADADFTELYPQIIAGLIDLFEKVKAVDKEIDKVNGAAPNAEFRRVPPIATTSLIQHVILNTKLVDLTNKQIWPPPTPLLPPEQVMAVPSHPGANWWEANQQRDAARHKENQRVANYYANQQKAREDREAAEARAARESNLRNGGTP